MTNTVTGPRVLNSVFATVIRRFRLALVALLLVTTFVTTCFAGPVGVYLALTAALASLFFAFDRTYLAAALRDWGVRGFLLSFFVLWASFLPSATDFDDVMGFVDFLAFPVMVPAFALLARHAGKRSIDIVAGLACLGALAALATGIYEVRILGALRAAGGTSPIFFSGMAILLSFFSLLGLLSSKSRWRWILLIGNAAGVGAAILGGTRGAMLGYLAFLLAFGVYTLLWWQRPMLIRLLTVAAVAVTSFAFSAALFDTTRITTLATIATEAATQGEVTDESTNQRFIIYNAAIRSIMDSPLYGHGWWHRFEAAVPYMGQLGLQTMAHDNHAHLHNDILNFGSAGGIIAILAYLILMASPLVSTFRSPRTPNWGLRITAASGLVMAYMIMGAVDVMFVFEIPKSMFVLCSAVLMAFFLDAPPTTPRKGVEGASN